MTSSRSDLGMREPSTFPQLVIWSYSEPERTTYIRQDFTVRSSRQVPIMPVRCRRFDPRPNDVIVDAFGATDGEIMLVQPPPFACVHLPPGFPCLLTHSQGRYRQSKNAKSAWGLYKALLIEVILATVNDEIYRLGLCEAVKFASEREVGVFSSESYHPVSPE